MEKGPFKLTYIYIDFNTFINSLLTIIDHKGVIIVIIGMSTQNFNLTSINASISGIDCLVLFSAHILSVLFSVEHFDK